MGVGTKLARISAVSLTPLLCASFLGWRGTVRVYSCCVAAICALWQLLGREERCSARAQALQPPSSAVTPTEQQQQQQQQRQTSKKVVFEPRIFRTQQVWSLLAMHMAYNNSDYSILSWAPIYFSEVLGVPTAQIGAYLVWPTILNMAGTFIFGALETVILKKVLLTELGVRRWSTISGCTFSAIGLSTFGLARSPGLAALAYCSVAIGQGLHHSGFIVNYLEVGGADTGMLTGAGNTLANLPGIIGPLIAVRMVGGGMRAGGGRGGGGSWAWYFASGAVLELACGLWFSCTVAMTPARDALTGRRAAKS